MVRHGSSMAECRTKPHRGTLLPIVWIPGGSVSRRGWRTLAASDGWIDTSSGSPAPSALAISGSVSLGECHEYSCRARARSGRRAMVERVWRQVRNGLDRERLLPADDKRRRDLASAWTSRPITKRMGGHAHSIGTGKARNRRNAEIALVEAVSRWTADVAATEGGDRGGRRDNERVKPRSDE